MRISSFIITSLLFGAVCSCSAPKSEMSTLVNSSLQTATIQSKLMAESLLDKEGKLPRTIGKDGKLVTSESRWWTSGFFPGVLWYLYEANGNDTLRAFAENFTKRVEREQYTTDNHDVGFMLYCSFGNGLRLTGNEEYKKVLLQGSESLSTRFRPQVGCIRSWDWNQKVWEYPVIIDNMMNLDLLFYVNHLTNDSKYKEVALRHAETTMKNHFRNDHSSYHVVSYNSDGSVEMKCTHQGKNDDSSWARGQAWGVYGYTSCYRESKDAAFLQQAQNIAALIMERVKTDDAIPLWDYDAPNTPETPRDASAASITASALIELSTLVEDGQVYFDYAEKLLKSLSSDAYLAKVGTNQGFILMHSTGSLPNGSEIDTPINYADYYYLEALVRYMQVKGIDYKSL